LPETTEYAGEQLSDRFAAKLPYSYGTATPTATDDGFLWYDENDTPPTPKFWDGAAFQALTSGKILQIVRATDSTQRTTTSDSFVDGNLSITITPTKTTSAVIIIHIALQAPRSGSTQNFQTVAITDSSNNIISGTGPAGAIGHGSNDAFNTISTLFAYDTPATTSATTYKVRFKRDSSGTANLNNAQLLGQMYALEVSA